MESEAAGTDASNYIALKWAFSVAVEFKVLQFSTNFFCNLSMKILID